MFLLGCNSMKQITDEKAIEIVDHILERQSKLNNVAPSNYKIVENISTSVKMTKYDTGKYEMKTYQNTTYIMDFENRKLYKKIDYLYEGYERHFESYIFYKQDENKTYELINRYGNKTRKEYEGPNLVETNHSTLLNGYVFFSTYLESINNEIKTQKEKSDYYKDSKNNKYKYGFYSKDDRSLEERVESKISSRNASERYDYTYNKKFTNRYVNDVLELNETNESFESTYDEAPTIKTKSKVSTNSKKISVSYGNNKFNIPNIGDYKLEA